MLQLCIEIYSAIYRIYTLSVTCCENLFNNLTDFEITYEHDCHVITDCHLIADQTIITKMIRKSCVFSEETNYRELELTNQVRQYLLLAGNCGILYQQPKVLIFREMLKHYMLCECVTLNPIVFYKSTSWIENTFPECVHIGFYKIQRFHNALLC